MKLPKHIKTATKEFSTVMKYTSKTKVTGTTTSGIIFEVKVRKVIAAMSGGTVRWARKYEAYYKKNGITTFPSSSIRQACKKASKQLTENMPCGTLGN